MFQDKTKAQLSIQPLFQQYFLHIQSSQKITLTSNASNFRKNILYDAPLNYTLNHLEN